MLMYWEISTLITCCIALLGSIVSFTEVGISLYKSPCEGWVGPDGAYRTTCPFRASGGICGLMNSFLLGSDGKFYFLPDTEPCVVVLVLNMITGLFCVIHIGLSLFGLVLGRPLIQRSYFAVQLIGVLTGLVVVAQLVALGTANSGYNVLCANLAKPRCTYPGEYAASKYNCHLGQGDLTPCHHVSRSESFIGRLRVTVGFHWLTCIVVALQGILTATVLHGESKRLDCYYAAEEKRMAELEKDNFVNIAYVPGPPGGPYMATGPFHHFQSDYPTSKSGDSYYHGYYDQYPNIVPYDAQRIIDKSVSESHI